jgi:uncharacterized protein DUF6886
MRLFHFSHDASIRRFEPRPVPPGSNRPEGSRWVAEAEVVWAIDEPHQAMYLFPRDCPRILLWQTPQTRDEDLAPWGGERSDRVIAHIEWGWLERMRTGSICRYEMPAEHFEDLQDAGMWVSRQAVTPIGMEVVDDLLGALAALGVELRVMPSLAPLKGAWDTSLHASGIRLRNAADW